MPEGREAIDAPLAGPARDWLAARRGELNARFRLAQRRFPQLDPSHALTLLARWLPPLAGQGEPGYSELLSSAYDLTLLHAGRGLPLLESPGRQPGAVGILLAETFPRLRRWLLARPASLPEQLSNAVENLGERGAEFARELIPLSDRVESVEQLVEAVSVLAWRLGEARLRQAALAAAAALPAPAILSALGLADWPAAAAPLAVRLLREQGWRDPQRLATAGVLKKLAAASPEQAQIVIDELAKPVDASRAAWIPVGRLGDFAGYAGHFQQPPRLLDAGPQGDAHRWWVASGSQTYRIDADLFGWVCRPDGAMPADERRGGGLKGWFSAAAGKASIAKAPVTKAGEARLGEHVIRWPGLVGASSIRLQAGVLAWTLPHSFRVRLLAPGEGSA